jgi:transcription elongation factor GreA
MDQQPMTVQGFEKITKELENLKNVERNAIAREIATAKEHGDLKENAEYHAAKEKQVLLEKRITLLQEYVGKAQVIDPSAQKDQLRFHGQTAGSGVGKRTGIHDRRCGGEQCRKRPYLL